MTNPEVLASLLDRCIESGVFAKEAHVDPRVDLVESGLVDSMGLLTLESLIEDTYGVVIPGPVFVAELRTLARIAGYLELELRAGRGRYALSPAAE